jgi:hypothetical protein
VPAKYLRIGGDDQAAPHRETIQDPVQIIDTLGIIDSAQIYDRIRERYRYAVNSLGITCYLYRKLVQGRPCTCMRNNIPQTKCPACFGSGIAGGWLQYGHEKFVLDASAPFLDLKNVGIADGKEDDHLRPSPITLQYSGSGAVESGEVIEINGALGYDGFVLFSETPPRYGGSITPYFLDASSSWQPLALFGEYLNSLGPPPWTLTTRFKVEMTNNSPDGEVPCYLSAMHVKWRTGNDIVKVEQASFSQAVNKLTDLGFINETIGAKYTMADRPSVSTRDFFIKANDGTRLKIVDARFVSPADQTVSQDLSLRPILSSEGLAMVF